MSVCACTRRPSRLSGTLASTLVPLPRRDGSVASAAATQPINTIAMMNVAIVSVRPIRPGIVILPFYRSIARASFDYRANSVV